MKASVSHCELFFEDTNLFNSEIRCGVFYGFEKLGDA
jgi:hypothetical protein